MPQVLISPHVFHTFFVLFFKRFHQFPTNIIQNKSHLIFIPIFPYYSSTINPTTMPFTHLIHPYLSYPIHSTIEPTNHHITLHFLLYIQPNPFHTHIILFLLYQQYHHTTHTYNLLTPTLTQL